MYGFKAVYVESEGLVIARDYGFSPRAAQRRDFVPFSFAIFSLIFSAGLAESFSYSMLII
jgi:hypothetical protein